MSSPSKLQFIVALRALASLTILWHHFSLYPPLRDWAAPLLGSVLDWVENNARATQVFFVVSGYVMARSLTHQTWSSRRIGAFLVQRYCRLGVPYLGAVALVIPAYALARGWLPEHVLGSQVSLQQLLAHLLFLQGILGYEQLSAGLWFVCINFQLGLMLVFIFWVRDQSILRLKNRVDVVGLVGWALSLLSLFHFNLNEGWDAWALYFFPYFFMGVVVHRRVAGIAPRSEFLLYELVFIAAMFFEWRWRLLSAFSIGAILLIAERSGWGKRWPNHWLITWLGNLSYSLFLVHFPVLILVSTVWVRAGWHSHQAGVAGLLAAFGLSLMTAVIFRRWIELPAARISRGDIRGQIALAGA